jgi:hypothetical protein
MTDIALVPLLNRRRSVVGYALVDQEDLGIVDGKPWHLDSQGYAARGKPALRMHRLILAPGPGYEVDHLNRNKLDNRRANLRLLTHAENTQNVTSKVGRLLPRGVYFDARDGSFYGQVKHRGLKRSTRRFATAEEAERAVIALRASILPYADSGRFL